MNIKSRGVTQSRSAAASAEQVIHQPSYTFLSFFGIYFLICGIVTPMFTEGFLSGAAAFAAVLVLMGLGYFLQAAVCAVSGFRRELNTRSYESEYKYFKPVRALPVWIVSALLALGVIGVVDRLLFERAKNSGYVYDPDSLVPFVVAFIVFAVISMGSYVWFFPYNRLMTGGALLTAFTIFFIAFVLFSVGGSSFVIPIGLSFMCYCIFAVVSANQYAIGRTYRGTVVSFLNWRTRSYNIILSVGVIALFLLLLFICYLIVNGMRVIVLFAVAVLLRATNSSDIGYTEDEEAEIYGSITEFIFATDDAVKAPEYWYFILFVALAIVALTFILTRRTPEVRKLMAWLKNWLVALFYSIFKPIADFVDIKDDIFSNYVDEEERMQKKEVRARIGEGMTQHRMSWREFNAELRSRHSTEEKYRFAYHTFVTQLRSMPTFVKKSDTPRKIKERLSASGRIASREEIGLITDEFEKIEFAAHPADASTDRALDKLCEKIKENM